MKKNLLLQLVTAALGLAGCGSSPSDNLADRVVDAADVRADNMENQAAILRNEARTLDRQAGAARDTAHSRAAAIEAAGRNVSAMSQQQRDAIVANQAPAVR